MYETINCFLLLVAATCVLSNDWDPFINTYIDGAEVWTHTACFAFCRYQKHMAGGVGSQFVRHTSESENDRIDCRCFTGKTAECKESNCTKIETESLHRAYLQKVFLEYLQFEEDQGETPDDFSEKLEDAGLQFPPREAEDMDVPRLSASFLFPNGLPEIPKEPILEFPKDTAPAKEDKLEEENLLIQAADVTDVAADSIVTKPETTTKTSGKDGTMLRASSDSGTTFAPSRTPQSPSPAGSKSPTTFAPSATLQSPGQIAVVQEKSLVQASGVTDVAGDSIITGSKSPTTFAPSATPQSPGQIAVVPYGPSPVLAIPAAPVGYETNAPEIVYAKTSAPAPPPGYGPTPAPALVYAKTSAPALPPGYGITPALAPAPVYVKASAAPVAYPPPVAAPAPSYGKTPAPVVQPVYAATEAVVYAATTGPEPQQTYGSIKPSDPYNQKTSLDQHRLCCYWAGNNECNKNPLFMQIQCQKSCGTVGCTLEIAPNCPVVVNTVNCPFDVKSIAVLGSSSYPAPAPGYAATVAPAPAPGYTATSAPAPAPGYAATVAPAPAPGYATTAAPAPVPGYPATSAPAPAPVYPATAAPAPAPGYAATAAPAPAPGYAATVAPVPAPEPGYGAAPEPEYGAAPEPEYGAAPEPGYGAAPELEYGAAPEPEYGAAPEPGYGAVPKPEYRVAPEPEYGAVPKPEYRVAPEPEYGAVPTAAPAPAPGYAATVAPVPAPEPGYGAAPEPEYGAAPEPEYGAAPEPGYGAAPELEYGAAPEPEYGAAPEPGYGAAPELEYGAAPEPEYGAAPEPEYGAVPKPEYRVAPEPEYGAVPKPEYRVAPEPEYGAVPKPEYRVAPEPEYGAVPKPEYRVAPEPEYGAMPEPGYGAAPEPAYGPAPKAEYGAAAQAIPPAESEYGSSKPSAVGADQHRYCCYWAAKNECDNNAGWMRPNCQKSCGTVGCTEAGFAFCQVQLDTAGCPFDLNSFVRLSWSQEPSSAVSPPSVTPPNFVYKDKSVQPNNSIRR